MDNGDEPNSYELDKVKIKKSEDRTKIKEDSKLLENRARKRKLFLNHFAYIASSRIDKVNTSTFTRNVQGNATQKSKQNEAGSSKDAK